MNSKRRFHDNASPPALPRARLTLQSGESVSGRLTERLADLDGHRGAGGRGSREGTTGRRVGDASDVVPDGSDRGVDCHEVG